MRSDVCGSVILIRILMPTVARIALSMLPSEKACLKSFETGQGQRSGVPNPLAAIENRQVFPGLGHDEDISIDLDMYMRLFHQGVTTDF